MIGPVAVASDCETVASGCGTAASSWGASAAVLGCEVEMVAAAAAVTVGWMLAACTGKLTYSNESE